MDQVNPLAELTHKRRMNAWDQKFLLVIELVLEVRDVHYTHYGRMCPIETPEGANIGLIVSLCNFTRVNDYGFLETPYKKVVNGKVTNEVEYLSAMDEEHYNIAQASALVDEQGNFINPQFFRRKSGDYINKSPEEIQYIDVSPANYFSSYSLIPSSNT